MCVKFKTFLQGFRKPQFIKQVSKYFIKKKHKGMNKHKNTSFIFVLSKFSFNFTRVWLLTTTNNNLNPELSD